MGTLTTGTDIDLFIVTTATAAIPATPTDITALDGAITVITTTATIIGIAVIGRHRAQCCALRPWAAYTAGRMSPIWTA